MKIPIRVDKAHERDSSDAERFWEDMRAHLAEFALALHLGKTRLIEFGRHAAKNRRVRGLDKPETFNFLGFTHISGRSQGGSFQLKRKSRSGRVRQIAGDQTDVAPTDA
jgi:RNA-directed DNA polymerase